MEYKKLCEAEVSTFYDEEHYEFIINDDAIGFKEDGSILFIFKKGVINEEDSKKYMKSLKSLGKTKTKNRGSGAGGGGPAGSGGDGGSGVVIIRYKYQN